MSTSATNFGPVKITETVLRDAHQSLLATRMRTEQMLPMLSALDKIGYNALEAWGGATYDTCLRFLNEDPWERLDTLKAHLNTPIQMLLRGQNLLGYNHYSDDVVRAFVRKASEHGVGVFRIFDALNDVTNLRTAIDAALKAKEKPHVQGCLVYTVSPFHTNETFVELAKQLQEMGVHSICIKDMSGLLKPYVAEDLVRKLKAAVDLPIELHTHYTSGFGSMTYLKAAEAGVDIIDCATTPFALGTSQPSTDVMVEAFRGTPYDTGLDQKLLKEISDYFTPYREECIENGLLSTKVLGVNIRTMLYQVPGGMLSNMIKQLSEQGKADKLNEVLEEVPRVRKDLGEPPLVTPSSQIVGTQAVMNVLMGERYKMCTAQTKDLVRGMYGQTIKPMDPEVVKKVIGDEERITCRPADLIPASMEKFEKEAKEHGAESEEDVLSYASFPQVATDFFKWRTAQKTGVDLTKADTKNGAYPA